MTPSAMMSDAFGVNVQRNITTSDVRLYFYDDGGRVRTPTSYDLQYWTGSAWASVPNQLRSPATQAAGRCRASQANSANVQQYYDNGTWDHLWELVDAGGGWYKVVNLSSGFVLAVQGASAALSAQLQQYQGNGTRDQLWRFIDAGGGQFKLLNRNSGLVLGVDGASRSDSANVVQHSDTGA